MKPKLIIEILYHITLPLVCCIAVLGGAFLLVTALNYIDSIVNNAGLVAAVMILIVLVFSVTLTIKLNLKP